MQQLADANQREAEARQEYVRVEREIAMARHEVKEANRRYDTEVENRRKVEAERTELRKKLEDETNRRTKEQNNNNHVVEKINSLERERSQLHDKLKKEQENVEKLKKTIAELQVKVLCLFFSIKISLYFSTKTFNQFWIQSKYQTRLLSQKYKK